MRHDHINRKPEENRTRIQDMNPFSELCRNLRDDPATIKRVATGSNKTGNVKTGRPAGPRKSTDASKAFEYRYSPANVPDTMGLGRNMAHNKLLEV